MFLGTKLKLSGADMLMRALHDEGVELIFGYPGGAALHIYDALFRQDKIEHILVRHEQGATHAADGYARATGKPGVVLVTSGPGATNAITGIATAAHVRSYVVAALVFRKNVVNCRCIRGQFFSAIGTFPIPTFKNMFSKLSTSKFWT